MIQTQLSADGSHMGNDARKNPQSTWNHMAKQYF